MTELGLGNGTISLVCDTAFLKQTEEELTAIFTQKFIDDVMKGYVFRRSSNGKPPVVVTISEVVAGAVKEQIDSYVQHCMALVTKERIMKKVALAVPKKRTRKKAAPSKKPTEKEQPAEKTLVSPIPVENGDMNITAGIGQVTGSDNTPDLYKSDFDTQDKDLNEQKD